MNERRKLEVPRTHTRLALAVAALALSLVAARASSAEAERILVTEGGTNAVAVIVRRADGTVNLRELGVGNAPDGIAVTPDGAFAYVANEFSNSVSVVDLQSNAVTFLDAQQAPRGVAISPDGAFAYVATVGRTPSPSSTHKRMYSDGPFRSGGGR